MEGAKLVACVQPTPRPPPFSFAEGRGVCTRATQCAALSLVKARPKISARLRNCGCVVCAKLNLPTFLRVNSFLPFFR